MKWSQSGVLVLLVLTTLSGCYSSGHRGDQTTMINVGNDRYLAGNSLVLNERLKGDLVGASGQADIAGKVGQDLVFAGGQVVVNADVDDDARVAGGTVDIRNSQIGGTAVLAGGDVELSRNSRVKETLIASGGTVNVAGVVDGGAWLAGNNVTISGRIDGPTQLTASQVRIRAPARINGDLVYASPRSIVIEHGAVVTGTITRRPWQVPAWNATASVFFNLLVGIGLVLVGLLVSYLFPRAVDPVLATLDRRPWASLGIGALALVGVPILAVAGLVLVIGIPFSVLAMILWGAALLLSLIYVAFYLARKILNRLGQTVSRSRLNGWMALVLLVISLVVTIPFLGGLIRLAVICFGMGALLLALWGDRARRQTLPVRPSIPPSTWAPEPT